MKSVWQRSEGSRRRRASPKAGGQRVKIFYPMLLALCPMLMCLYPILFCYANDDISRKFYKANSLYEQGSFDEAVKQYESILENGLESGNLYYNLGNCYFKKGEIGRTILNYEKARRLIPQDLDLESNYEYGCSLIKSGTIAPKKSLPPRVLNNLFAKFTVDGLTILLGVFYILILVSILINLLFRSLKKHALMIAVLIGLFFIVGLVSLREKIALLNKEAIVITEQADAKFEPFDEATTYFTLPEGSKIITLEKRGDWRKVKRPDGRFGWVRAEALEII